ncbi:1,4-dihydroxy-2-naphthoate prenyltransferase [Lishizhenia tianjinensis]|uniref:1,4-dihydroxy-2-naphthoate octaprenyltransferase n=1 Tax=Lishizhenia tianjinensis TaxID=477690 RepID=A0A1I6YSD0_9FLAO|nr:1,4-dihydroxy-2-naphthoate octaprenyltransferase [Lishizhenia tianjinensis]SFT53350.1 1,4-dihydroxy-2-naphthoate prenyltransferase [Lishizhenia tianjinensis]
MTKMQAWVSAARLRTLPLSISGILFGSFYAYYLDKWDGLLFGLAMATTLLLQILSNFANDLGDTLKGADNEGRVGPQRSVQSGAISVKEMKGAVILFSVLSLATAIPLVILGTKDLPATILYTYIFLAVACVIAAITYTMGKKAYGYNGLGDVFVFIFFGLVSTLGIFTLLAKSFDVLLIIPAIGIGLLSTAVLNLNNLRDHENDAKVGKNTIIVKMGYEKGKRHHYRLISMAFFCFLTFFALQENAWMMIGLLPFALLMKHLNFVKKEETPQNLDPELKKVALSTFLICLLSSILFVLCR